MIVLDTRELDHPIPLEKAVAAFRALQKDEIIQMIHRREPLPLFEILSKNGGRYRSVQKGENLWYIFITSSPSVDLENLDV